MSALREQYTLLREFWRDGFYRLALGCAAGLLAAVVVGYAIALAAPDVVSEVLDAFQTMVEEAGIVDEAGNVSVFSLLVNNWHAMLLSAGYGFVPFLFLPILSLLSNGILLGIMAGYYQTSGFSMAMYLAGILPHGVFELTALVLSIACGICLCRNLCRIATRSPRRVSLVELLSDLLRMLLLIVMPLTVAAAFIECYITPLVIALFLP